MSQQNATAPAAQNRRMFRGRGGPTDRRRIPLKHKRGPRKDNAHLRNNKYDDDDDKEQPIRISNSKVIQDDANEAAAAELVDEDSNNVSNENNNNEPKDSDESESWKRDMEHLHKRIRNVRNSIQLSSSATLSQPTIYQTNVLLAVQNCVKDYKAILKYHDLYQPPSTSCSTNHNDSNSITDDTNNDYEQQQQQDDDHHDEHDDDTDNDQASLEDTETNHTETNDTISDEATTVLLKAMALSIFELIQLSVQCGPLSGAKPAYLKRCGSHVAALVLDHLKAITNYYDNNKINSLYWTPKQVSAIESWKVRAEKAVIADKPPSKHVEKQQHQGIQNQKHKKEARNKKRDERIKKEQNSKNNNNEDESSNDE
jgi:hypothetical protein